MLRSSSAASVFRLTSSSKNIANVRYPAAPCCECAVWEKVLPAKPQLFFQTAQASSTALLLLLGFL
jgi:hypothetical protein